MPEAITPRSSELQVRLTGDRVATVLVLPSLADHQSDEPMPAHGEVAELFWKHGELNGQQLELGQPAARLKSGDEPASFACGAVHVAYIKLVPLTQDEAAVVEADRNRADTKRLFAHNDSHGPHWIWRLTTFGRDSPRDRALPRYRFQPHVLGSRRRR